MWSGGWPISRLLSDESHKSYFDKLGPYSGPTSYTVVTDSTPMHILPLSDWPQIFTDHMNNGRVCIVLNQQFCDKNLVSVGCIHALFDACEARGMPLQLAVKVSLTQEMFEAFVMRAESSHWLREIHWPKSVLTEVQIKAVANSTIKAKVRSFCVSTLTGFTQARLVTKIIRSNPLLRSLTISNLTIDCRVALLLVSIFNGTQNIQRLQIKNCKICPGLFFVLSSANFTQIELLVLKNIASIDEKGTEAKLDLSKWISVIKTLRKLTAVNLSNNPTLTSDDIVSLLKDTSVRQLIIKKTQLAFSQCAVLFVSLPQLQKITISDVPVTTSVLLGAAIGLRARVPDKKCKIVFSGDEEFVQNPLWLENYEAKEHLYRLQISFSKETTLPARLKRKQEEWVTTVRNVVDHALFEPKVFQDIFEFKSNWARPLLLEGLDRFYAKIGWNRIAEKGQICFFGLLAEKLNAESASLWTGELLREHVLKHFNEDRIANGSLSRRFDLEAVVGQTKLSVNKDLGETWRKYYHLHRNAKTFIPEEIIAAAADFVGKKILVLSTEKPGLFRGNLFCYSEQIFLPINSLPTNSFDFIFFRDSRAKMYFPFEVIDNRTQKRKYEGGLADLKRAPKRVAQGLSSEDFSSKSAIEATPHTKTYEERHEQQIHT